MSLMQKMREQCGSLQEVLQEMKTQRETVRAMVSSPETPKILLEVMVEEFKTEEGRQKQRMELYAGVGMMTGAALFGLYGLGEGAVRGWEHASLQYSGMVNALRIGGMMALNGVMGVVGGGFLGMAGGFAYGAAVHEYLEAGSLRGLYRRLFPKQLPAPHE